jgi:hypothetical protein
MHGLSPLHAAGLFDVAASTMGNASSSKASTYARREPCIPRATLTTESGRLGEKLAHINNLIRFDIKRL